VNQGFGYTVGQIPIEETRDVASCCHPACESWD
jgi:hypothetical protein